MQCLESRRLLAADQLFAITYSSERVTLDADDRTVQAAMADLNGDGELDLVIGTNSAQLEVFLASDGSYVQALDRQLSGEIRDILIADVNADGMVDILVGTNSLVSVLLNGGLTDANWNGLTESPSVMGPVVSLAAADLSSDGQLDLIVGMTTGIQVHDGVGDGSFNEPISYVMPPSESRLVSVGDVNNDEHIDVVAFGLDGGRVLQNDGSGILELAFKIETIVPTLTVELTDLDNDSSVDLVLGQGESQISILRGNGDATFSSAPTLDFDGFDPTDVASGDFNGDGVLDIVAAQRIDPVHKFSDGGLYIWYGNGDLTFAFVTQINDPSAIEIAVLDVNGDGLTDIAQFLDNHFDVLLQTSATSFRNQVADFPSPGDLGSAVFGDLDGDEFLDAILEELVPDRQFSRLTGTPQGDFTRSDIELQLGFNSNSIMGFAGNVNGDQQTDVIYFGTNANGASVLKSLINTNGVLAEPITSPVSKPGFGFWFDQTPTDLNNDGITDLVLQFLLLTTGKSQVVTYLGNGDGTFSEGMTFSSIGDEQPFAVGDINGDGNQDIIAADRLAQDLQIIFGDGDGGILAVTTEDVGIRVRHVEAVDVNADGVSDLVLNADDSTAFMLGSIFGPSVASFLPLSETVTDIRIDDFDGDDIDDIAIVLVSNGDAKIGVMKGIDVNFYEFPTFYVMPGKIGLKEADVADVNLDGVADLIVPHATGFLVFSNNEVGAIPGDFNHDGNTNVADLDLLCEALRDGGTTDQQSLFDLTNDGELTLADVQFWVQEIRGTQMGDTNLDGQVAFADFLALSANFGSTEATWSDGDFNCDGIVAFADFLILANNFGLTANAPGEVEAHNPPRMAETATAAGVGEQNQVHEPSPAQGFRLPLLSIGERQTPPANLTTVRSVHEQVSMAIAARDSDRHGRIARFDQGKIHP